MTTAESRVDPVTTRRWHVLSRQDVLGWLDTSEQGLTDTEAARRTERDGRNELPLSEATPAWRVLARQLVSPLIGILVLCLVVTLVLRKGVDAAAILVVLLLNARIAGWRVRSSCRSGGRSARATPRSRHARSRSRCS